MKILFCILYIFILFHPCKSQTISDWLITEGQMPAQNITPNEAIVKAIKIAERNAIEKFCGIKVHSQTLVHDFKLGADFIETISHGYIIEAETLSIVREDFRKSPKDPFIDLIKVKLKVKVAKADTKPDPYFQIKAKLDKNVFVEGETTKLIIRSTKDCYLNIFNIIEDGKVYQIYPLHKTNNQLIKAGESWQYPQPLMAACLPGCKKNTEIIKVIGTKEPLDFLEVSEKNNDFEIIHGMRVWKRAELGLEQLLKTIIAVPVDERTEDTVIYKIFKNE